MRNDAYADTLEKSSLTLFFPPASIITSP